MPTRTKRSTSTRSKKKIEIEEKENVEEIEWSEDQEKQLKKYFTVYQDLPFEDSLHLTAAMLIPQRSTLSIAMKLFQLKLLNEDKLLGHFPELEGKIESSLPNPKKELEVKSSKPVVGKKNSTSSKSNEVEEILKKIVDTNVHLESVAILKWISEKLEEAKFPLEFHQMTIKGESVGEKKKSSILPEVRPLFEILPMEEKEWEYLKNRHVQKLFGALGMTAPLEGGFWSISDEVSLTFLISCLSSISVIVKQIEDAEKRKKEREKEERMEAYRKERMAAMQENTMGSILSSSTDKKSGVLNPTTEAAKKRTVGVRSPMRTLNPNIALKKTSLSPKKAGLDDIFSSPQHKKTRNVSKF